MKVIGKSNFDNETVDDILVSEHETSEDAEKLAEEMNFSTPDNGTYYYKAVPDDYKLYRFEP